MWLPWEGAVDTRGDDRLTGEASTQGFQMKTQADGPRLIGHRTLHVRLKSTFSSYTTYLWVAV